MPELQTKAAGAATCPECGVDLATKNRAKHARAHWGVEANTLGTLQGEAAVRAKAVLGVS